MKNFIQRFCFLCLIFIMGGFATAIETIQVGDRVVNGSILKSYRNRWKIINIGKDGKREEQGVWTDQGIIKNENGRKVFQWIHESSPGSHFITINLVDLNTLAPIRSERKQELGDDRFDIKEEFEGTEVISHCTGRPCQQKLNFAQGETTRKVRLDQQVFDYFGGLWGMFFPAIPLKENYDARFPVFSESKGIVWVEIHVRGLEPVNSGPGKQIQGGQ